MRTAEMTARIIQKGVVNVTMRHCISNTRRTLGNYFGIEYSVNLPRKRESTAFQTIDSQMRELNHFQSFSLCGWSRLRDRRD